MRPTLGDIALRSAGPKDFDFWRRVHRACFKTYVEQTWGVWDEADQLQRLQREFSPMRGDILFLDGHPIGFIWVDDQDTFLFINSIALLPEFQNQGIGTKLLQQVIAKAEGKGLPVRLQVLKANPARTLYERLGFCVVGGDDFRHYMERTARSRIIS
jgi:ribosomal protein S18 acetylase RimI-like enzyme